jgi:hypothetical protein
VSAGSESDPREQTLEASKTMKAVVIGEPSGMSMEEISKVFPRQLLRGLLRTVSEGAVLEILDEGLLIIGWVAMWRPLEIFLYDWVPIRRRCRVFAKLSSMPVVVQSK